MRRTKEIGPIKIFDGKDGTLIAEIELKAMVCRDKKRNWWRLTVNRREKKKCPHCGAELK